MNRRANEGKIIEAGKPEEICRRYDHLKKIRMHLSDGKAETIHSTEPTLETVFLELTGRDLQEGA